MTASNSTLNHLFNASTMTTAINRTANQFGLLNSIGLATVKPISTTVAIIKMKDGILSVLGAKSRGDARKELNRTKEKAVLIEVPHFPHGTILTPQDIQDRFAFVDNQLVPETAASAQADLLEELRTNHDITLEKMKMGMLFGKVFDGDGDELVDLHEAFGVTKTSINFQLDQTSTNVREKCRLVRRHIRKNARGAMIQGKPLIPCSTDFYDMLIKHESVERTYMNAVSNSELRTNNSDDSSSYGEVFEFGDCIFQTYDVDVPMANGTNEELIPQGSAVAFPQNTKRVFQTFSAPANRLSKVNKAPGAGELIYVNTEILPKDKGVDIDTEMNAIAINSRPEMVPTLTAV